MTKIYDAILKLDSSPFVQGLTRATDQLKDSYRTINDAGNSFMRYGRSLESTGKMLTGAITAPVMGVGAAALKAGRSFTDEMNTVQAVSGATGKDFEKLTALARKMGAETKFSASESAEALKYMGMAGWDTQQMTAGLEPILNLAVAAGTDLATTSDIVTDALTAFGMKAEDTAHFTDVLAQASNSANTDVVGLGEAFKYVAPVAGSLGYSVEDVSLALGTMANAGIKGAKAGRALSTSIMRLGSPTKEMSGALSQLGVSLTDSEGKMLPLRTVLEQLRGSFKGLTEEQQLAFASTIFGKDAASSMLPILNASQTEWDKLAGSIDNAEGATKRMRDIMEDSLGGDFDKLKSAAEGALLDIFDIIEPTVRDIMQKVSGMLETFHSLPDESKERIVKLVLALASIGPTLMVFGKLNKGIGGTILKLARFGKELDRAGSLTKWLGGRPIGLTLKAFKKLGGAIGPKLITKLKFAGTHLKGLVGRFFGLGRTLAGLIPKIASFVVGLGPVGWAIMAIILIVIVMIKHWDKVKLAVKTFVTNAKQALTEFHAKVAAIATAIATAIANKVRSTIERIKTILYTIVTFVGGKLKAGWDAAWGGFKRIVSNVSSSIQRVFGGAIDKIIGKVNDFVNKINSISLPSWLPGIGGAHLNIPTIPGRAIGDTNWQGGLVQVHERGGEILDLPQGSRIMPHDASVSEAYKMGRASSKPTVVNHSVTIPKLADQIVIREDADIDRLLDKMERRLRFAKLNSVRGTV
ncbi:phage tail tape measure protein [Aedoeadaptatus coli]|uniref:phage tail tape measure protein n=1 Tax=Aedoeadaptatus coli TaxID=2058292 RepID=UPI000D55CF0C|nr:phage tail tape measure protein [Peptoniphilus coli]